MPTPTYTPLANITLGANAATVTFSSISQIYRDLVLITNVLTTGNNYGLFRLNSDATTSYPQVYAGGTPSPGVYSVTGNATAAYIQGNFSTSSSELTNAKIEILDYSATDKHKPFLIRQGRAGGGTEMSAGRWANTAAITSITLSLDSGQYAAGSTFALYGVSA